MPVITIATKQLNSGSIYDIASDAGDIEINMGSSFQYAVVLPSYYNADPTRHKTDYAAIKEHDKLTKQGYQGATILDRNGKTMDIQREYWGNTLVAI